MFYWTVLFSLATVVAGVFALFGSEVGGVLALLFFALGLVTLMLARRGAAPRNLGPDS
jgi:hypothetical protein